MAGFILKTMERKTSVPKAAIEQAVKEVFAEVDKSEVIEGSKNRNSTSRKTIKLPAAKKAVARTAKRS
jgi:hypothetical protein